MIDLVEGLPRYLVVGGRSYPINTDYRIWLRFGELLQEQGAVIGDLFFIFEGDIPTEDFLPAAIEFYQSENATPRAGAGERLLDYFLDGEYIYGSILSAYGIDILETNHLHYHKFKAMVSCLPDWTKLSQIIGYRAYKPSKKKPDTVQAELKSSWSLPVAEAEKESFLAEIDEMFYNT